MNPYTVEELKSIKFSRLSLLEKIEIKSRGLPRPDFIINTEGKSHGKVYVRKLIANSSEHGIYKKNTWICGCDDVKALFCFPCLLYGGNDLWSSGGMSHPSRIKSSIASHEKSFKHKECSFQLNILGTTNIAPQLSISFHNQIIQQNERITRNRDMLNVIINCIRFCGAFELAMRGHGDTKSSNNPVVFHGLINFAQELDLALKGHMESSDVFKGPSKTIQNELLDVMLDTIREEIKSEIDQAPFLAAIADETTDIAKFAQLATVFRYVCADGSVVERFWGYKVPDNLNADGITAALKQDIHAVLGAKNAKLVCQAYNGAAVMAGHLYGVQTRIKHSYPHAHYIHCECPEDYLAIQKLCCPNPRTSVFFNSLRSIHTFYAHSNDHHDLALDASLAKHFPPILWYYNTPTVNIVYENQDAFYDCFCKLESNVHTAATIEAASNLKRMLEDEEFCSWLGFFHQIMPHAEVFFKQIQAGNVDAALSQQLVQDFVTHLQAVRIDISKGKLNMQESENLRRKRRRGEKYQQTLNAAAIEVCDTIISQINERFSFTAHLEANSLVFSGNFARFEKSFPTTAFNTTLTLFPMLDKVVLETELRLLYQRIEFRWATGAIPILKFILANNLKETFCETVKLLQIVCTMPMTSGEAERGFSTLQRIKTFLRNSMGEVRLNAIAMLSIEKQFVNSIIDFNMKVIDRFARIAHRRMDFSYKKM